MIDRKYGDKPVHYEISIGTDGIEESDATQEDMFVSDSSEDRNYTENNSSEKQNLLSFPSHQTSLEMRSTTAPMRPVMTDRQYYHLPIEADKPCLYVRSSLPDHRRRAYNSNIIDKVAQNLEIGLEDVQEMMRLEKNHPERRLRGVIEELIVDCG